MRKAPYILALLVQSCFGACATSWTNGYAKCVEVTLLHAKIPNTDQTAFPNMICFNGAGGTNCDASLGTLTLNALKVTGSGGSVTSSTCLDCIWTSDNAGTTLLNWETDTYVGASGFAVFWVQKTRSHTTDDKVYLFIGKSGASDQSNPAATFPTSTWQDVFHLGTSSSLIGTNSTGRLSLGLSTGLTAHGATASTGQISGGPATDTAKYLRADTDSSLTIGGASNAFTLSCWGKTTGTASSFELCMAAGANTGTNGVRLGLYSGCPTPYDFLFYYGDSVVCGGGTAYNDGTWHYFVGTVQSDGISMALYVDGVQVATHVRVGIPIINSDVNPLTLARAVDLAHTEDFWPGTIDEVRISAGLQFSADQIVAEFNDQGTPSMFYTAAAPVDPIFGARHKSYVF